MEYNLEKGHLNLELALNLHQSGFKTFNIAVGNNLMEERWASDLFRLNKSFIIQRSGGTKKEIYLSLKLDKTTTMPA